MDWFAPKYRRDPNAKVEAIYHGVANGGGTVTSVVKPSVDKDRMEATRTYGPPTLARGQGGQAAVIILGGMETSLAEMEYILEAQKERKFQPRRSNGEIAEMCQILAEKRNDLFRHYQKNPSEKPTLGLSKGKPRTGLYLPQGYRWAKTSEPGLKIRVRN